MGDLNLQIQEMKKIPNNINPKKSTARHIIIKLLKIKDKEKKLKAAWKKYHITSEGIPSQNYSRFITWKDEVTQHYFNAGRKEQSILHSLSKETIL